MPKLKDGQPPSYRLHRQSGKAIVTLAGRDILLGPFGSAASRLKYRRLTAEWLASSVRSITLPSANQITIKELIAGFWEHAERYYRRADGSASSELENFRQALRPLKNLYGDTRAIDFGPLALKALTSEMIRLGWCRTYLNRQLARIKTTFKWATSQELLPPSIHQALATVSGVRAGRSEAREAEPVKPVPEPVLAATLPHLGRHVRAMVDLQLLTGARPGEIVTLRTRDIERSRKVWLYKPPQHKTVHRGHVREIRLGPKAQEILAPFLRLDLQAFIFSPINAEAERLEALHASRTTPLSCGNVPGSNRTRSPQRCPSDHYTVDSYRRAIARACDRAFQMPRELLEPTTKKAKQAEGEFSQALQKQRRLDRARGRREWRAIHVWHPHQLRHSAATLLRRLYGIEAARLILGHRSSAVTELYAEIDSSKAEAIMAQIG